MAESSTKSFISSPKALSSATDQVVRETKERSNSADMRNLLNDAESGENEGPEGKKLSSSEEEPKDIHLLTYY